MLTYAIERFLIPLENWRDRKDDRWRFCTLDDYRSNLISYGFMCRESCELYEDKDNAVVYLAGILGHHSALEDSLQHPHLGELQEKMAPELVAERSVQRFDVNPDDTYCEHDQWETLILGCNCRLGAPSIICGQCSGLIAAYRVKMSLETATRLWAWERQYSSIDNLSGLCDEYEEWADKELHSIDSMINTLGLALADQLANDCGCEVNYRFDPGGDKLLLNCPECGRELKRMQGTTLYKECSVCRIMAM